jgi:Ni,Fe-hydrogenase III large subunit
MAGSTDRQSPESRVLDKARDLAEEVRQTAERVHQEALEAHRLTEIARRHSERGRELSRIGRNEARAVGGSIKWSLDLAHKAGRRSGKDKD